MIYLITRIGVYVDSENVTLAVVSRGKPVWLDSTPLNSAGTTETASVDAALGLLLDRIPKFRWPRPSVDIALGVPWARVKRVRGLPPLVGNRALVSVLRLNAARFVASSRPIVITGATVAQGGDIHAGLADHDVIDVLVQQVVNHDLRIGRIVPATALALATSTADHAPARNIHDDTVDAEAIAIRLGSVRERLPLALDPRDNTAAARPDASPRRILFAGVGLVLASLLYVGVRVNSDRSTLADIKSEIAGIATVSDSGAREQSDLGRLDADLARAASFSGERISASLILGEITQALPLTASMTTLRIDTAAVDIVVLSDRTAAVVDALGDLPDIEDPTIIGPVSRETVGQSELERATIRLQIARDYKRGKVPFHVERDRMDDSANE